MSAPRDPLDVVLPDLSRVADTALPTAMPLSDCNAPWTTVLGVAAATLPGVTPGEGRRMVERVLQHVVRECGVTAADHPACEAHPFVQAVTALAALTHDPSPVLHPVLRSPEWVAVHGVAFDGNGERVGTPWSSVAWPTVPPAR